MERQSLSIAREKLTHDENHPQLQTPYEFLADFVDRAKTAQNRIVQQTMYFGGGTNLSKEFQQVLAGAVARGVPVTWGVDNFMNDFPDAQVGLLPKTLRRLTQKFRTKKDQNDSTLEALRMDGVDVRRTNMAPLRSKLIPVAGRIHSKIAVIDDTAWLLEPNLGEEYNFSHANNVVRFTDPAVADVFVDYAQKVHNNEKFNDYSVPINDTCTFYADAGTPGRSVIRDTAISMVRSAEHDIKFASQFPPSGKMRKELIKKANEGKVITFYTSKEFENSLLMKKFLENPNIQVVFNDGIVHSKALLIDADKDDNTGKVLFGTNNIHPLGIWGGTGEIAIKSADQSFVKQVNEFFVNI